jgi:hypothetical protein
MAMQQWPSGYFRQAAAMPRNRDSLIVRISRRRFLEATAVVGCAAAPVTAQDAASPPPDPMCQRCNGVGRIPLMDARPLVWLKGTPLPSGQSAVGEQFCPLCQSTADPAALAAEKKAQLEAALEKNKQWEKRMTGKLACIVTRHATVHTQLTPSQARNVGNAIESLTLHLKNLTQSLLLTPTRPDTLELVLLWEKPSWDRFRKAMESLYTIEQLGSSWYSASQYNAYDHVATPHMYETPQSLRTRPPSCGAVFLVGRRQLNLATDWHAPFWLVEGFAAYGDHAVHKVNRWYTVYDVKQIPVGDWLAQARQLASDSKLRTWKELMNRELRDWEAIDHIQSMAMAAFLLESEPNHFLDLTKRLKRGEQEMPALETAYRTNLAALEDRLPRWLLTRRL